MFREKTRRPFPKYSPTPVRIDRFARIEKPRKHASCVRFDDRNSLIEGKAGKGASSVFADPGELLQSVDCSRELSTMPIHDHFCCRVEISRASIIAEALPRPKDFVFRSFCERGDIRKSAQPFMIVRNDGGDLRLLEHDFRDEDCVRIAGLAPGEIAAITAMPIDQSAPELIFAEGHRWRRINTDFLKPEL
jgi:hypothetical protein